ncbi:hypothetical protein B0A89_10080 [Paracoccus contaminans]|uniref:Uncharacterized protein n=2 Tax=Paracoccus contaminans TaxID=1945662 RepID=A0A1W6CYJ4_9RHOB|nr:hypothetical protein B0A89_10080 [Paracoccus contaminans]
MPAMIVIAAAIIGAIIGDRRACAARGDRKDRLQFAAIHALIFGLLGLFASILIDRWLRG